MEEVLFCQIPNIEPFSLDVVDVATTPAATGSGCSVGGYVLYGCLGRWILFEVGRDDVNLRSVVNDVIRGRGVGVEESGIGLRLIKEVSGFPRRRVSETKNTC